MQRIQKFIISAVVISEVSHIFCCVLPTVFSLLSLLSALGMTGVMPHALHELHHALHDWEQPMIALSALLLAFGWGSWMLARGMDCRATGCTHEPCRPRKTRIFQFLKIATALFVANLSLYLVFHH